MQRSIMIPQSRFYKLLFFALSWLLFAPVHGQSGGEPVGYPPLQVIKGEQGLPQAFVSGVVEDDDGFMWVSTLGGLARYDGRQMLPFYHQPDNPASPLSNTIILLIKGGPNELWLRYGSGEIDRVNTKTGQCQHLPKLMQALRQFPNSRDLHVDRRGNLWGVILNGGIFHYDIQHNQFTHYTKFGSGRLANGLNNAGLISDTVSTLTEDPRGRIWVVTPGGLSLFTPDARLRQSVRFNAPIGELRTMAIHDERVRAFVRPGGEIMLNTRTSLLLIDAYRNNIRAVPFAPHPTIDQPLLRQTTDGTAYLVAGGTLYRYADKQGLVALWRYVTPKGTRLNDLLQTSMWVDRTGVLWLGANTKGLFRIDLTAAPLHGYEYQSVFCTDAFQTGLGISLSRFFHWPFGNLKQPSSYLFRQTYDRQGRLWMGIGNEVGYYTVETRRFVPLPCFGATPAENTGGFLRGISLAPDGQLWVVSTTGTPLRYDVGLHRWQAPFGQLTIPANNLLADTHALWVTTGVNGLIRFDKATRHYEFIHFKAYQTGDTDEQLLDLYQDTTHPDWLWISGYQGLICFNKRTRRYRRFTMTQGLPDNTVYSILPDRQGYLWLSTNRGLCRFHPITHAIRTFGLSDGLPGEEFNRFHGLQLPDGRLAFGGVDGWVLFDPAQIKADTTRPMVAITGLKINNQPVDPTGRPTTLPQLFNTLANLPLTYDQNYLTVDFAALHYHQPDRVTYRYQLEGYDPDWTRTAQPTASYTKLPPGRYTLRVDAANTAGQWSPEGRTLTIDIRPPIWASRWAYGLYALLFGSALWGLVRFRTTRTRERQELALRQRQADELRQLDEAKTRFFTNVSHELRTPLTLMLGPLSSVLSRHRVDAYDKALIQTADRSARQLLKVVNELLDLTRLEAGKLTLQTQPVRLSSLLGECLSPFAGQAQQLGLTLTQEPMVESDPIVVIDADNVRRVIQNLLANACKFTPPGGTIRLWATDDNNRLRIGVTDTGRGIHADDLPHVFDRYFQTQQPDTPLEGGTGIGLALCQELMRLMHGTITVASTPGRGSSFAVDLPLVLSADDSVVDDLELTESVTAWEPLTPGMAVGLTPPTETVLIVEDNADLRGYLTTVLSPALRVLTAANGQVALTLLADLPQRPSLIIADIMMPVMDGFQLLETLKSDPAYRTIPVVMLTARTDRVDKLRALRLGVDDYLLKPFEEAELIARVTALLHNQRERQRPTAPEPNLDTVDEAVSEPVVVSADDLAWLERMEHLTANRLGQFDLTADDLADDLAMTRRTFYRTIKRLTGLTPAQYVAEARFRQARQLLETRQVSSVKQVAHRVGYRQASHFAQLYQQRFGKNPADYR